MSQRPEKPGTTSVTRISTEGLRTPQTWKKDWLAQMSCASAGRKTAIGSGKFCSVLLLAVSVEKVTLSM